MLERVCSAEGEARAGNAGPTKLSIATVELSL